MTKGLLRWLQAEKLVIIILLAILHTSIIYGQQSPSVDGLIKLLERPDDSSKVVALKLLCWEYRNTDTANAIKYGLRAINLAQKLELKYELADIYNRIGVVRRNQGKYSHALDNYFRGIKISKANNYKQLLALAYNNVADIYNRLGIYDKALEFGKYGLETSSGLNDNYTLSYIYNILGVIYKNRNDLDSSLHCFNYSLNLRKKINFSSGIGTSMLNIGSVQFLKGQYDSCYLSFTKAIEIYNEKNDQTGLVGAYKYLGVYYNKIKDYKNAVYYFNRCLVLNEKFGDLQIAKEANDGLNYSYVQLGDIRKAYYYKERACNISDSITVNLFVERITHLTENYKFELKRHEDDLIQKERETLLKSKIKLYIFILLLLIILIFVFAYHYQQKKQAVKKLRRQKHEIDELNSTKDKLFSILAHDLKNPISSVIGIAEILKDSSINLSENKRSQLISNLYDVGMSSHKLLDEVLNWARIQTNQVSIKSEEINLKELINSIVANQTPMAEVKNISINSSLNTNTIVYTDSNIVSTVLRNLLSNAIKYSYPNGEIQISVESRNDFHEISVKDSGVGMTEENRVSLLSITHTDSKLGTANEKGSGLGLIICKEFISKIGGQIYIEPNLDGGTNFKFTIPITPIITS